MKASYNWLKEFVDIKLTPDELAHSLTMSGLEVEGLHKVDNDVILDINVTPNRADCLSINGIAREMSAILGIPLKATFADIKRYEGRGPDIEIRDTHLCQRYASRLIIGVKPAPSPDWLVKRLEAHGVRTSYNIVDVTNYVMLEMGQPLHAFDLDKLSGKKIMVKTAGTEVNFKTLDEENRNLSSEILMIWDAEKPVAIAGIMGGLNTEVVSSTKNVLLESAYFFPASIRRTSKSLNIKTESSYRFERGIDLDSVVKALDRAAFMIAEIAGGQISELTDIYPSPYLQKEITIKTEKINSIIGTSIQPSFIEKTLNNLGLANRREGDGFIVAPPGYRQDIQRDVDIIEEIARLYGYEKIPSTLPEITIRPARINNLQHAVATIKNSMLKSGFSEAINYSFMSQDTLDKLKISSSDKRRNTISIINPLRKEDATIRTSLIPSLISNITLNLNRGEKGLRLFEISKTYFDLSRKLPEEIIQLAAIYDKDISQSLWGDKRDGFYDLKGVAENLLIDLKICDYSFDNIVSESEPFLHPGKSCSITLENEKIGYLGALHPVILEQFDIKGEIFVFEISDISKLLNYMSAKIRFKSLPKFPYVERDMSIIVSREKTVNNIKKQILSINSPIIESVKLFDIFTGKTIPEDKISLAFSIRYRAKDKTLTDEEVDTLHSSIVSRLMTSVNAELRS